MLDVLFSDLNSSLLLRQILPEATVAMCLGVKINLQLVCPLPLSFKLQPSS